MTLKEYKVKNRYTWDGLGELIGVSGRLLEKIEQNKSRRITLKTAIKIKLKINLDCWEYLDYCDELKKKK